MKVTNRGWAKCTILEYGKQIRFLKEIYFSKCHEETNKNLPVTSESLIYVRTICNSWDTEQYRLQMTHKWRNVSSSSTCCLYQNVLRHPESCFETMFQLSGFHSNMCCEFYFWVLTQHELGICPHLQVNVTKYLHPYFSIVTFLLCL